VRARLWLFVVLYLALTLSGCMQKEAFRTVAKVPPSIACPASTSSDVPAPCRQAITETTADYDLHFVEFDDQGWTYPATKEGGAQVGDRPQDESSQQLLLIMKRLRATLAMQPVRIFVFVHGWKHNAAYDDENVVNFRDFLKEAALYEKVAQSTNRVVGIYVGWRGKSLDLGEPWISATFWDRKTAAQHVAVGSVRELSAQLRALQRQANGTQPGAMMKRALPDDPRVRIYMIGHSFGGLALYAAVSQSLVYGFITGEDIDGKNAPVERLGDMIVLINPAFEATRFQPLNRVARNRDYDVYQSPVFVAITSEADAATGKLFPLGRTFNTIFETELTREEGLANRNTPGHIDAYLTHRLDVAATDNGPCPGWKTEPATPAEMAANIQLEFINSQKFKRELVDERWPMNADKKPIPRTFCGGLVLTPLGGQGEPYRNPDPNMPMWNLAVSGEIVPGHNDINRPLFRAFLRQLFLDEYFNARVVRATPPSEPQLPR
jgi:hypothetical protein